VRSFLALLRTSEICFFVMRVFVTAFAIFGSYGLTIKIL
jgi:hypothetical protein